MTDSASPWFCPNTPRCPHPGLLHDVEDLEDPLPTCCVDGCRCGQAQAAAARFTRQMEALKTAAGTPPQDLGAVVVGVLALAEHLGADTSPQRGEWWTPLREVRPETACYRRPGFTVHVQPGCRCGKRGPSWL